MKNIRGLTYEERVAEYMQAGSRSARILELIREGKTYTEIMSAVWKEFGEPNKGFNGFGDSKFFPYDVYEVYRNVAFERLGIEEFQPRFKIGMKRAETIRKVHEVGGSSIKEVSRRANITGDCAARTLKDLREIDRFEVRITQDEYVRLDDWLGGKWQDYQDMMNGSDDDEQDSEADD